MGRGKLSHGAQVTVTTEGNDLGEQCSRAFGPAGSHRWMKVGAAGQMPQGRQQAGRAACRARKPCPSPVSMLSHCWSLLPVAAPTLSPGSGHRWAACGVPMPGLLHLAVTGVLDSTAYHLLPEPWVQGTGFLSRLHTGVQACPACPRDPGAATSSCCVGEPLCPSHLLSACGSPFLEDR